MTTEMPETSSDEIQEVNRGWYFPSVLVALYESAQVNAEELMLLGKINALCHRINGCFAQNRWLAEWWGKHIRHVSRTISRFEELGLVKIETNKRGRRSIHVTFQGDDIIVGGRQKCPGGVDKNVLGGRQKCPVHLSTPLSTTKDNARCAGDGVLSPSPIFEEGKSSIKDFCVRFAEWTIKKQLHLRICGSTRNGWEPKTIRNWERTLENFIEDTGTSIKEVGRVFDWYENHHEDEWCPVAKTIPTFCKKYSSIYDQMTRSGRNGNGNGNHSKMPTFDRPAEGGLYVEDGEWKSKITVIKDGKRFRVR